MQILSINDQMKNLTKSHSKLEETTNKITTVAEHLSSEEKSRSSWADIVANSNGSEADNNIISTLTKQVLNNQKKLSVDGEERVKTML